MTISDIRSLPPLLTLIATYIAEEDGAAEGFRQWCGSAFSERAEIVALNEEAAKPSSSWRMLERLAARCTVCFDRLPLFKLPPLVHRLIRDDFFDLQTAPDSTIVSADLEIYTMHPVNWVAQLPALRRVRFLQRPSNTYMPLGIAQVLTELKKLEVLDLRRTNSKDLGEWMWLHRGGGLRRGGNEVTEEETAPLLQKLYLNSFGPGPHSISRALLTFPNLKELHLLHRETTLKILSLLSREPLLPKLEMLSMQASMLPSPPSPVMINAGHYTLPEDVHVAFDTQRKALSEARPGLKIEVLPLSTEKFIPLACQEKTDSKPVAPQVPDA